MSWQFELCLSNNRQSWFHLWIRDYFTEHTHTHRQTEREFLWQLSVLLPSAAEHLSSLEPPVWFTAGDVEHSVHVNTQLCHCGHTLSERTIRLWYQGRLWTGLNFSCCPDVCSETHSCCQMTGHVWPECVFVCVFVLIVQQHHTQMERWEYQQPVHHWDWRRGRRQRANHRLLWCW